MQTSRKLTHALVALFALVLMSAAAFGQIIGQPYPADSPISDQKAGSVLIYNFYTSASTPTPSHNTQIAITNTSTTNGVVAHLYFVGQDCTVIDFQVPLSKNQTTRFTTQEFDPGFSGYLVVVAEDFATGTPISFNRLIGDEYVKLPNGASASLAAEAISAVYGPDGTLLDDAFIDATNAAAVLRFGQTYNALPTQLAVSSVPSRADGNETTVILNRIEGSLIDGMLSVPRLAVLVYDDRETPFSSQFLAGQCQKRLILSDTEPRLVTRFSTAIPKGRSGWIRINTSPTTQNIALLGAVINYNPSTATVSDAFNGGHNLHKLSFTNNVISITVPVFPIP